MALGYVDALHSVVDHIQDQRMMTVFNMAAIHMHTAY